MEGSASSFRSRGPDILPVRDYGKEKEDKIPLIWNPEHVGRRLVHAMRVVRALPDTSKPGSGNGFWPEYTYEWGDLLAQQQTEEIEKKAGQAARNHVRFVPSPVDISHMELLLFRVVPHVAKQSAVVSRAMLGWAMAREKRMDMSVIHRRLDVGKRKFWSLRSQGLTYCNTWLNDNWIKPW